MVRMEDLVNIIKFSKEKSEYIITSFSGLYQAEKSIWNIVILKFKRAFRFVYHFIWHYLKKLKTVSSSNLNKTDKLLSDIKDKF